MSKATNYFLQTYSHFSNIKAVANVSLVFQERRIKGETLKSDLSIYSAELSGPFIFFQNTKGISDDENISKKFYIFCPFFMVRFNSADCSIDLIPIYHSVTLQISINFRTYNDAIDFQTKIRKAKSLINNFNGNYPPLVAPVVVCNTSLQSSEEFEMSSQGNIINFTNDANVRTETITIDMDNCIIPNSPFSSIPYKAQSLTFTFGDSQWDNRYCICSNRDILQFGFVTIYLIAKKSVAKTKRSEITFARHIPPLIPDMDRDKIILGMKKLKCHTNENFKCEVDKTKDIEFKKVVVPVKASSNLELLAFDFKIKRKVIIYECSKNIVKTPFVKAKRESIVLNNENQLTFEEIINNERAAYKNIKINIDFNAEPTELFDIESENVKEFFSQSGKTLLTDFINPHLYCKKCKEFCKIINLQVTDDIKKMDGYTFCTLISSLIVELVPKFSYTNPRFSVLCAGFAQVLLEDFIDKESFNEKFVEILKMMKLSNIFFQFKEFSTRGNLMIFISRLIKIGKLSKLFLFLQSEGFKWITKNYKKTSLLQSAKFAELIYSVSHQLDNCTIEGELNKKQFVKGKWFSDKCVTRSTSIKHCVDSLSQSVIDLNVDIINEKTNALFDEIIDFFKEGFIKPPFSPVETMRHPWYCFVAGSAIDLEDIPQVKKMRDSVQALTTLLSKPEEMLRSLLFEGLKYGMLGEWVLLAGFAGENEDLYRPGSSVSNKEELIAFANPLFCISDFHYSFS